MQTAMGRCRLENGCALEIKTFRMDHKIWFEVNLKNEDLSDHADGNSNNRPMSEIKGLFSLSESVLRALQSLSFSVFQEMGFDVHYDKHDGLEKVKIGINVSEHRDARERINEEAFVSS